MTALIIIAIVGICTGYVLGAAAKEEREDEYREFKRWKEWRDRL